MRDERTVAAPAGSASTGPGSTGPGSAGRGFQPAARRRNRIAIGVLLAAVAIGGNIFIYSSLNSSDAVVQVVRDVPAGALIDADMLRSVDVDADSTVNLVAAESVDQLVGSYARVRMVAGSLITHESVQSGPLVSEGSAVVAIQVGEGALPIGLRERVPVVLVIPTGAASGGGAGAPVTIEGRVVGLPAPTNSALGVESLSVEVAVADAATLAAADDVRVVLVEPTLDPASSPSGSPATSPATSDVSEDGEP